MANRKRNIQIKFYVTEDEKRLIDERMKLLPTQRYGAYLRKMAINGYIIYTDTADIKAFTKELSAIGRNINQIAKRVNAGGPAYQTDMDEIRERLDEIWELQRRILSSQRYRLPLTISAIQPRRTESCLYPPMAAPPKLPISNLPGPTAMPSTRVRTWAAT